MSMIASFPASFPFEETGRSYVLFPALEAEHHRAPPPPGTRVQVASNLTFYARQGCDKLATYFKRQLGHVRGRALLAASSGPESYLAVRASPCQVQVYAWERHLATLSLPSDPTCLDIAGSDLYIGCRAGKVYRVCLARLKRRPRSGPRSPHLLRLGEEEVWLVHRGVRLLASCSAGLVVSGDITPTALYSTSDRCARLVDLSALDEEGEGGGSLTCLRCLEVASPQEKEEEALAPWVRAFGVDQALLRAPVVVAGRKNGAVSWASLSTDGPQCARSGTWRCGGSKGGAVVAVCSATAYGAALVALCEFGEAFVVKGQSPVVKGQSPEASLSVQLSDSCVGAACPLGSSCIAYLCGGRVRITRLDVLVRTGRSCLGTSSPACCLPADVVALCSTSGSMEGGGRAAAVLVVLTSGGRLLWRSLPPDDDGPSTAVSVPEALRHLEQAHGRTRAMEGQLARLGLELDRLSGALSVVRQAVQGSGVGWAMSVHPHNPQRADLLLHLTNRSPHDDLPLLGWQLLLTISSEYKPWLQLLVAPPTPIRHTHVLPLRDLAPAATLPLPPIPLHQPSLLHRVHVRLTLYRPSSVHLRPGLRPGWNAAGGRGSAHGVSVELGHGSLDGLDLSTPPPLAHPQPPSFTVAGLRELEAELQQQQAGTESSLPLAEAEALLRLVTQGLLLLPSGQQQGQPDGHHDRQPPSDGPQPFFTWTLPSYVSGWGEGEERCLASLVGPLSSTCREVMLSDDGRAMVVSGTGGRMALVKLASGVTELGLEGPPRLTLSSGSQSLLCEVQAACRWRLLRRGGDKEEEVVVRPRPVGSEAEGERQERAEAELLFVIKDLQALLQHQQEGPGASAEAQSRRLWRVLARAADWYRAWSQEMGQGREAQAVGVVRGAG